MPLNRVTMATATLQDFILLSPAKRRILVLLAANRNMRDRPLCPSHYRSYQDIADELEIKEDTVKRAIYALVKDGWLTGTQKASHNVDGKWVMRYKWSLTRFIEELQDAFEQEEDADETAEFIEDEAGIFIFEGKSWRQGGTLGWQCRKHSSRDWADTLLAPDEVLDFFGVNILDQV